MLHSVTPDFTERQITATEKLAEYTSLTAETINAGVIVITIISPGPEDIVIGIVEKYGARVISRAGYKLSIEIPKNVKLRNEAIKYAPNASRHYLKSSLTSFKKKTTENGNYIYAQLSDGRIGILPDYLNHPQIFGGDVAVVAAGEIKIRDGIVIEVNNISGNFRFSGVELPFVVQKLSEIGFQFEDDAIKIICE